MNTIAILKGRYQIIKELRSGAIGRTYVATDRNLPSHPKRLVKQLDFSSYDYQSLSEVGHLFEKEAKTLEKLGEHSQIPQLFAYFEEDKNFYIVQEFIPGKSLDSELVPGKPLSEKQVINLLIEVLEILAFVHQNQVIHRNIKPQNLIRRQSDSKLVLLSLEGVKEIGTQFGNLKIGTPGYMPKEQYEGNPKICSDIYAVGMIGIQACTGQLPKDLPRTSQGVVWRKYAQVSSELAEVIDKMVRESWQERYQFVQEVLDDLKKVRLLEINSALVHNPNYNFIFPDYLTRIISRKGIKITATIAALAAVSAAYVAYNFGKSAAVEGSDAQVIKQGEINLAQREYEECFKQAKIIIKGSNYYSKAQDLVKRCDDGVNWKNVATQSFKEHSEKVWDVAFSPDKKTFASSSRDQTIKLWSWPSMKLINSLEKGHSHSVLSINFGPDGRLLASGGADTKVNLWKPRSMEVVYTKWHGRWVWAVAISPDGKLLASGSEDKTIKVWDLQSGRQWLDYQLPGGNHAHSSIIYAIAFTPDSKSLISASADKTIKIWDLVNRKPPRILTGHSDAVRAIAISPDGQTLVSGSWDKTIKVWDLKQGTVIRTLKGHSGQVLSVSISPDGKTLATSSADGTIKVWDLPTGKLLNTLTGHSGEVLSVAFSPDGKALASGGTDKTVRIWQR